MRDIVQNPGDDPPADHQHHDDEGSDFGEGDADHAPDAEIELQRKEIRRALCSLLGAAQHPGERGQQHQR